MRLLVQALNAFVSATAEGNEIVQSNASCPQGTVAVVVSLDTVGFTDGVHLFSSDEDAERWMLQEICQHGGNQSHLTIDEFQQRLKPHEDFYVMELHDRRQVR